MTAGRMLYMRFPPSAQAVLDRLRQKCNEVFVVGGSVVDAILGDDPVDYDFEVYGHSYEELAEILAPWEPKLTGKQFGIIKLSHKLTDGVDIDVSVPRRDNKVGTGHKGFEVILDKDMTPKEAAKRRDLSINCLYWDPMTCQVIDHFGGLDDLIHGIIRATDPATYVDDPVRPLRAMQLLARKGKVVDEDLLHLVAEMTPTFEEIATERVYEEFRKLLMKSPQPSIGLQFLVNSGYIINFPELGAMVHTKENPEWHPEGTTWGHVMNVVDNAAKVREWMVGAEADELLVPQGVDLPRLPEDWTEAFMWAALLHDCGKPTVMEPDGTAHGHDKAAEPVVEAFLDKTMNGMKDLRSKILSLVTNHMQPFHLSHGTAKPKAWRKLHNKVRLDVLGWLSRCDGTAGKNMNTIRPEREHLPSIACWSSFEDIGTAGAKIPPVLMGRHLKDAGFNPGPQFGKALAAAYDAQLENPDLTVEELLDVAKRELS